MTLEEATSRLSPYYHCFAKGSDLWVEHNGYNGLGDDDDGWSFKALTTLAEALSCRDIDLQAVRDWDEGLAIERKGCGCDTCGYGDLAVVRGILT